MPTRFFTPLRCVQNDMLGALRCVQNDMWGALQNDMGEVGMWRRLWDAAFHIIQPQTFARPRHVILRRLRDEESRRDWMPMPTRFFTPLRCVQNDMMGRSSAVWDDMLGAALRKKVALIEGFNPRWEDLSRDWFDFR